MSQLPSIEKYRLTDHALFEMQRRQISETNVKWVLLNPGQTEIVRTGRVVYQSIFRDDISTTLYLLRVFIDIDRDPPEVVTVYRTSKISKYWRV